MPVTEAEIQNPLVGGVCPECGTRLVKVGRYCVCPMDLEHTKLISYDGEMWKRERRRKVVLAMAALPVAIRINPEAPIGVSAVYEVDGKKFERKRPGYPSRRTITARIMRKPGEWTRIKLEPL